MERIEKWAKKYPGDVRFVSCDDDYHASGMLVLIEHRARASYMGTTAVFVPQCTGEPPVRFFLYPRHTDRLIAALQKVRKAAIVTESRESAREQADMKWWNSRVAAPKRRRPQTARPKKVPRATSA